MPLPPIAEGELEHSIYGPGVPNGHYQKALDSASSGGKLWTREQVFYFKALTDLG